VEQATGFTLWATRSILSGRGDEVLEIAKTNRFQPAEELGTGAQAMIDDHLFDRFPKPDVILGQHVMPPSAGQISYRPGVTQSEEDNIEVRLFGRGGHGAWPEATIDPIVMAAAAVLRLQTIVSREIAAFEPAVVTVGSLQAGTKGNVIPDEAVLKINVRSFDDGVRARLLGAIKRIVTAEATASGAPDPPVSPRSTTST